MVLARLAPLALLACVRGQIPGMGDMPKKPKPAPMDADIKYIRCAVCERAAGQLFKQVEAAVAGNKPAPEKRRRFDTSASTGDLEAQVEEIVANVCDADKDKGGWMAEYDVVKGEDKAGNGALLLEHKGPGHCRRECRTIAKTCAATIEKVDSELPELLLEYVRAGKSEGTLIQRVCTKLAGVCKKGRTPAYPAGKVRRNEEFKEKTQKDIDNEKLMETLKGMPGGGGMQMLGGDDIDLGDDDGSDGLKDEV